MSANEIWPMNATAAGGIADFDRYGEPQVNFVEQVYLVTPLADSDGKTTAVLHDASITVVCRSLGPSIRCPV